MLSSIQWLTTGNVGLIGLFDFLALTLTRLSRETKQARNCLPTTPSHTSTFQQGSSSTCPEDSII